MEIIDLAKKIQLPIGSQENEHYVKRTLRSISKKLRAAYYKEAPNRTNVYSTPFGGPIGDSIGPWPEFILPRMLHGAYPTGLILKRAYCG